MFSSDTNIDTIARLAEELRRYALLKGEHLKLDIIEKAVKLLAAVAVALVVAILVMTILAYLSLCLAFALEPALGKVLAFAVVAGAYLLLLLLCLCFRKQWFERPLVRFLLSLLHE